jgi:hypothetical protein
MPSRLRLAALLYVVPMMANAEDVAGRFTGTWNLVSYERRSPAGDIEYPYGKAAVGRLTYDGQGHMSAQIMSPDRGRFQSDTPRAGTPDEKTKGFDGYIAYCGTYSFEPSSKTVIHHVEASLYPNWVGSKQRRHFEFEGDKLILSVKNGSGNGSGPAGSVSRLIWARAKSAQ